MKRNPFLAIELTASGLKCDAPSCDFRQEGIRLTYDAIIANTGRPCPKCGANLLTEDDAQALITLRKVIIGINIVALPFMLLILPITLIRMLGKTRGPAYRLFMDGSGYIKLRLKRPDENRHTTYKDRGHDPAD